MSGALIQTVKFLQPCKMTVTGLQEQNGHVFGGTLSCLHTNIIIMCTRQGLTKKSRLALNSEKRGETQYRVNTTKHKGMSISYGKISQQLLFLYVNSKLSQKMYRCYKGGNKKMGRVNWRGWREWGRGREREITLGPFEETMRKHAISCL